MRGGPPGMGLMSSSSSMGKDSTSVGPVTPRHSAFMPAMNASSHSTMDSSVLPARGGPCAQHPAEPVVGAGARLARLGASHRHVVHQRHAWEAWLRGSRCPRTGGGGKRLSVAAAVCCEACCGASHGHRDQGGARRTHSAPSALGASRDSAARTASTASSCSWPASARAFALRNRPPLCPTAPPLLPDVHQASMACSTCAALHLSLPSGRPSTITPTETSCCSLGGAPLTVEKLRTRSSPHVGSAPMRGAAGTLCRLKEHHLRNVLRAPARSCTRGAGRTACTQRGLTRARKAMAGAPHRRRCAMRCWYAHLPRAQVATVFTSQEPI